MQNFFSISTNGKNVRVYYHDGQTNVVSIRFNTKMNWTHRRPFRHQFNYGGGINKPPALHRPMTFSEHFHVPKLISDQPIDAIRLQLADYQAPHQACPVHHSRREHPYITTFSDQQSSVRRTRSSLHSISTIETDFVHQRVSTIHTYPSSPSIMEQQQIIDEDNPNDNLENHQARTIDVVQDKQQDQSIETDQCRTCVMLLEILDQQAQQIRQYTEQISQQADLLAKLARRFAGIEEGFDDQKSDKTSQQQTIHLPI